MCEDCAKRKFYGFCLYITFYYMTDVDDYETINVIITMHQLIKFCIEEYF